MAIAEVLPRFRFSCRGRTLRHVSRGEPQSLHEHRHEHLSFLEGELKGHLKLRRGRHGGLYGGREDP